MNEQIPAEKQVETLRVQLLQAQAKGYEIRLMKEQNDQEIVALKNALSGVGVGENLAKEALEAKLAKEVPAVVEGDTEE